METTMLIQMTPENLATIVEEAVKEAVSKVLRKQEISKKTDDLLTIEEASKILNLSADTVRRKANDDEIDAVKIGKQWLIKQSAIDEFLKICKRRKKKSRKQIESEASTYIFLKNQESK